MLGGALPLPDRRGRRPLLAVALLAAAVAVAFAEPGARSAILRLLHLGGVTIERVTTLPAAEERPLASGLGVPVSRAEAEATLGTAVKLPPSVGRPRLYLSSGFVSVLLATPEPVLLSEFGSDGGPELLKKLVGGSTGVEAVELGTGSGIWISGAEHVLMAPTAPPRLAGNVLIWQQGRLTFRLEGRTLTREVALRLAGEISG